MTTITLINPFSNAVVEREITELSQAQLDAYANLMDEDVCEELADALAPCRPDEFLAAWVERVGPEEAGRVIIGS